MGLNIRSLRKHWNTFKASINSVIKDLDVIVLSEINVSTEEGELYGLPGFNCILKCRPNGKGGGILIMYRNYLDVSNLDLDFVFGSAEYIFTKINIGKECLIMASLYRPPSQNVNVYNHELEEFLNLELVKNCKNLIIIGDINLCYLSGVYGSDIYLDILYSNGLLNTITEPTRTEFNNNRLTSTCLDHINVRLAQNRCTSFIVEEKIADHFWIGVKIKFKEAKKMMGTYYKEVLLTKKINQGIEHENWWPILDINDPEEIYHTIVNKFNQIYRKATIKIKTDNKQASNPWFDNEIKNLIDYKNYLWKQVKRDKYNLDLRRLFTQTRNRLTSLIRNKKKSYYIGQFSKNATDSKNTWAIINQFINKKERPTILQSIKKSFKIKEEDEIQGISESFKDTFKESIERIQAQMVGRPFDISMETNEGNYTIGDFLSMNFTSINGKSFSLAMSKINTSSAAGPDGIRPKDVVRNITHLKQVLIHLIQRIFDTGYIPLLLKKCNLRPIHKSGSKSNINCYRPIGSTSVIMKTIEHFIGIQLRNFLSVNEIINKSQYGFVPNRSTIDLLEELTSDINKALHKNKLVIAVATDLSKAFDLVNYRIMLQKLQNIGIGGKLLHFFENYFEDRKLSVTIGQYTSRSYNQECGLIQGSVLSPMMFNIYVNDLGSLKFNSKILQYADDNILYLETKDPQLGILNMQQDLNLAVKYFFNNAIKLNSQKTKAIIFHNPRVRICKNIFENLNLTCHEKECMIDINSCSCDKLFYETNIKHLGLYLDTDMKYKTHIENLKNRLRVILFICQKISWYFPIPTKRIIYFSMVQSCFYYGISLYYLAPKYILNKLTSVLKRIYKVLFDNIHGEILGIMDFESMAKFTDLKRNYFIDRYRNYRETGYNIRNRNYDIQRFSNIYGKLVPEYRIPALINSIPNELRNLPDNHKTKQILKHYYLNEMYKT